MQEECADAAGFEGTGRLEVFKLKKNAALWRWPSPSAYGDAPWRYKEFRLTSLRLWKEQRTQREEFRSRVLAAREGNPWLLKGTEKKYGVAVNKIKIQGKDYRSTMKSAETPTESLRQKKKRIC